MGAHWRPAEPAPRTFGLGVVLAASLVAAVAASVLTVALVRPDNTPITARPATALVLPGTQPTATASSPAPAASAGAAGSGPSAARSSGPSGSSGSAAPGSSAGPLGASPSVRADPDSVIVEVAAHVSPAVVTITSGGSTSPLDPFSGVPVGVGSGFVFDPSGLILTNNHVVEGATSVTVAFKTGRQLPARVVASDADGDLAVLKVDATNLPTAQIGTSKGLSVGQLVIAIGSPLATYTDSVTSGILSAMGRSITVRDDTTGRRHDMKNLLQTDAAINPGNSGGPLLDSTGRVIGINSAVATSAEGIGFAIPIDAARSIMDDAVKSR